MQNIQRRVVPRVARYLAVAVLFVLPGCILFVEFEKGDNCVSFIVDDELITADPSDVFPGDAFELHWQERYLVPSGGAGPSFSEVQQTLTLHDPVTDELLVKLGPFPAPKPDLLTTPGGRPASIAFSEFTSSPDFDPMPRDYLFRVAVHESPGSGVECDPTDVELASKTGEFPLELLCDCDGHNSYGLRVEAAGTIPASPITEGTEIQLVWTNVYDGLHCAGVDPVASGDFQASIQVTGDMGSTDPLVVDVPSMLSGTSAVQSVPISDILAAARPAGTYQVTLILDQAGSVPECTSQGTVNTTDQIVVYSFEVVP
jgi:hypothetical protein